MVGLIFLFFSILIGMWVFARIMYPTRGHLPLPNQNAPAQAKEQLSSKPIRTNQVPISGLTDNQVSTQDLPVCATCGKAVSPDQAITQAGLSFCSAEHLIEYQQSN